MHSSNPKILVSGGSGFVGRALIAKLNANDYEVSVLSRKARAPWSGVSQVITWDPLDRNIDSSALEGFSAVFHLAGESVVGLWTAGRKHNIKVSRVQGTEFLVSTLCGLRQPPGVLISASAVGYYGNRADEELSENSAPGTGFLAEVAKQWEAQLLPARNRGMRVVAARLGVVLGRGGGALSAMRLPFSLGLGGRLGGGTQYMSWVGLEDVVDSLMFLLQQPQASGPYNIVAPNPVQNAEFVSTLADILQRPAFMHVPTLLLELLLGEFAHEMLLASQRVYPQKLEGLGYNFHFTQLREALLNTLGK